MNQNQDQQKIEKLQDLLVKSIKKTTPKKGRFGLLFSGGIDSSIIAIILKKLGYEFTCYTVEFHHPNFKKADDVKYVKLLAKKIGLSLKIVKINIKEVEKAIPKVIDIIKSDKVTMMSIALPLYFCLKKANSEKIKTVLYGCAIDCIFAGFHKHKISRDLNQACIQSLKNTYKIGLPRDKSIANHFKINLKVPFLNKDLISFALALPKQYKINKGIEKYILRKTALNLGLPHSIAFRKKRAIQYSSNSQKALKKLAKKNGFKKMGDYLQSLEMNT